MGLFATGGSFPAGLTPSPTKTLFAGNYLSFDSASGGGTFAAQFLPDVYEKEVERYGNRSVASFLRMVGAEIPSSSDQVIWSEQGRLHLAYTGAVVATQNDRTDQTITITGHAIRAGQTVVISSASSGNTVGDTVKAYVISVATNSIEAAIYTTTQWPASFVASGSSPELTVFVYGSEFAKGSAGMVGSVDAGFQEYSNSPIIIKDKYSISGSDAAQIGWVEVTTENGASGYLWYLKSEHETRLRFDDYLETAMIEAVPAEQNSGAAAILGSSGGAANPGAGSDGIFYSVQQRGNIWDGGNPTVLADFDNVISRLDKQGAIEENVLFVDRQFAFDIDDMLAAQNAYGAGGTSYGLFDNDEEMALNLGFSGFRRGYDFYKTDWKYLNDPTMRGGLPTGAGSGRVNGLLVPAGSTSVYDQILGKNAKRPFLHVRYRASETEDRRYKTWITGSAGGAATSSLDAMEVNFLSERAVCTLGANNFFLFQE